LDLSFDELKQRDVPTEILQIKNSLADKQAASSAAFEELQAAGSVDNEYTTLTPAILEGVAGKLQAALDSRSEQYANDLSKKEGFDKLCVAFSDIANPFLKKIDSKRDSFTNSVDSMDSQLEAVQAETQALASYESDLQKIKDAQAILDSNGIVNNPHSNANGSEVSAIYASFVDFLSVKASNLRSQIEAAKNRGITAAQLAEFERNFNQFDTNGSRTLNKEEFKQCLYSLGENKQPAEIDALIKEYGDGQIVPFDGFVAYMKKLQGNSNTKEALLDSVCMIGPGGAPPRRLDECKHLFSPEQLAYLEEFVPKKANGEIDFAAWVEESFKR